MACEKSVERREVKFLRVFERLINYCVLVCYEYAEDCLKKDGILLVGKRHFFFSQSSICLQDIEIQSFAQPLNIRKISSKFPLTKNSQATKLKELKIVNSE